MSVMTRADRFPIKNVWNDKDFRSRVPRKEQKPGDWRNNSAEVIDLKIIVRKPVDEFLSEHESSKD